MITSTDAVAVMYKLLSTQPYKASSHYTITEYSNDPLLNAPPSEFKTEVLLGPAAKAYTPSGLLPK